MSRRILTKSWLLLCLLTPLVAAGSELTGRVVVAGRKGHESVTTIVYAEPLEGRAPTPLKHYKLLQKNKTFVPRVLAVPVGSSVEFTNEDQIFHNVFSLSAPAPFDLGLYRAGQSKTRTFSEPAVYRVFCNIHPQMTAVVLVVPTPYITETDASGAYRLDLPPGRYRLTAWTGRGKEATADVNITTGTNAAPDLALDESHFIELPHKNKYGEDYPKKAYEDKNP